MRPLASVGAATPIAQAISSAAKQGVVEDGVAAIHVVWGKSINR